MSEYAQKKFTPALLQCLHDRNVSLPRKRSCDGWTCTCDATLPVSAAALGGDGAGRSPRPPELAPSRRSGCVSLPADQVAPAGRQRGAQTVKPVFENGLGLFSAFVGRRFTISVCRLTFQPFQILLNPVGRTGNEFDKEVPVKWPSWIYCLFVVSPCSGRSSRCAENNFTRLCCVSEAERYRCLIFPFFLSDLKKRLFVQEGGILFVK